MLVPAQKLIPLTELIAVPSRRNTIWTQAVLMLALVQWQQTYIFKHYTLFCTCYFSYFFFQWLCLFTTKDNNHLQSHENLVYFVTSHVSFYILCHMTLGCRMPWITVTLRITFWPPHLPGTCLTKRMQRF